MSDKPHFVFRDGMTADRDYVQWIADIKNRYRNSQIKAAIKVNSALLEFYWSVGRRRALGQRNCETVRLGYAKRLPRGKRLFLFQCKGHEALVFVLL